MAQLITDTLRRWIVEQAQAGCTPESVLQAMKDSGWDEATAMAAMEESLRAVVQAPRPVPFVRVQDGSTADGGDRRVSVLALMHRPTVVVLGGLLSHEECDELVASAGPRMGRSETVRPDDGQAEIHEARTSSGMFFERGESDLIRRIEQRMATLLHWPVEHGEGLQVLHYRPGAEYKAHHDYFDPAAPGTAAVLRRGGQRVGTLVVYLNTPDVGGATTFPDVGLEVAPIKGNAVFFSYDRPHPVTLTLHAGAPVTGGEKWVATKWLREGVFT
ncbi:MAG: 2-oxoglutarate-dependent dioxygenase [Betaproteobacteria bacterium]|jgi:prolyl 4-hydroxylase|nr:2-oxoglutarate-dependent dioxygenase [Betaproteobacteria bacterium]NBT11525.1 2-oxoglutarate-dependent dioxygenase [Betaproteobacteria bacterium]NBU48945.1 2-oxoglutarate-dependent dioxygenase [Betaproteobacteria bacterium]